MLNARVPALLLALFPFCLSSHAWSEGAATTPASGQLLWISVPPFGSASLDAGTEILGFGVSEVFSLELGAYPEVAGVKETERLNHLLRQAVSRKTHIGLRQPRLPSPQARVTGDIMNAYDSAVLHLRFQTSPRKVGISLEMLQGTVGELPSMAAEGARRVIFVLRVKSEAISRKSDRSETYPKISLAGLVDFSRAVFLTQQGRVSQAIPFAESCLKENPGFVPALVLLGTAQGLNGKFIEACGPLQQAVERKPDLALCRYRYALALLGAGNREQAEREFDAVAEKAPGSYLAGQAALWREALAKPPR